MSAGRFFGNQSRHIETPSFLFAELDATVPDREVPRHTHEVPHFVLILGGIYVTEARNQDGLCPPGTLIFNPGGTTHRDRFRSSHGRFLSITPLRGVAKMLERPSAAALIVSNPLGKFVRLPRLVDLLSVRRTGLDVLDYEPLGLELVDRTINPQDTERIVPGWLDRAKELLDDCVARNLPISDVAQAAGVHPVSLARSFRKHFGCTPGEYQRRLRLARLRATLAGSQRSLADAALECGFTDQSQMTRAFGRMFGISPARFRRLGIQNDKNSMGHK